MRTTPGTGTRNWDADTKALTELPRHRQREEGRRRIAIWTKRKNRDSAPYHGRSAGRMTRAGVWIVITESKGEAVSSLCARREEAPTGSLGFRRGKSAGPDGVLIDSSPAETVYSATLSGEGFPFSVDWTATFGATSETFSQPRESMESNGAFEIETLQQLSWEKKHGA